MFGVGVGSNLITKPKAMKMYKSVKNKKTRVHTDLITHIHTPPIEKARHIANTVRTQLSSL